MSVLICATTARKKSTRKLLKREVVIMKLETPTRPHPSDIQNYDRRLNMQMIILLLTLTLSLIDLTFPVFEPMCSDLLCLDLSVVS